MHGLGDLLGRWCREMCDQRDSAALGTSDKPARMLPLDALRGLVMVVMALDHANHFVAHGKLGFELWSGQFPNYRGDGLAFLTRFVTHLAAPGFFFLMGVGMTLFAVSRQQRGWSRWRTARHFVLRGLLLIFLQILVENPAWRIGQAPDPTVYFGVLYSLGGAMVLGVLFLALPSRWLIGLSVLLILATEWLLPGAGSASAQYAPALRLWLIPGYTPGMFVLYPVMPWLGVTGLGVAYGRWLERSREGAYWGAIWLGLAGLLVFLPIRLLGGFGNIRPALEMGWIQFLNVVKYPPSIAFLLLTLGGNSLLLGLLARAAEISRVGLWMLAVYGRTPLFFYVTHLYLYGYLGQWIDPYGVGIPRMFPYWLLGLVVLFPLCWLYGRFKHSRSPDSLWRFL